MPLISSAASVEARMVTWCQVRGRRGPIDADDNVAQRVKPYHAVRRPTDLWNGDSLMSRNFTDTST